MNNDPRIALGHLVFRLSDAALSQGYPIDRDFILMVLEDAGLMWGIDGSRASFQRSPLAKQCEEEYLATLPEHDPDER